MKIPDKVRIDSIDYSIELTDDVILVDRRECNGDVDLRKRVIRINKNIQSKQGMEKTLLHEIVHGIISERNLDFERTDEETIVDELARGFHQVIRDNPGIFKE